MELVSILILLLFAAVAFCGFMLVRNERVYRYRTKLSEIVFSASIWDYKWRLEVMQQVSYHEMALKFWKPLDSFYPDKSFLDLTDVRGFAPWEQQPNKRREYVSEFIQLIGFLLASTTVITLAANRKRWPN